MKTQHLSSKDHEIKQLSDKLKELYTQFRRLELDNFKLEAKYEACRDQLFSYIDNSQKRAVPVKVPVTRSRIIEKSVEEMSDGEINELIARKVKRT